MQERTGEYFYNLAAKQLQDLPESALIEWKMHPVTSALFNYFTCLRLGAQESWAQELYNDAHKNSKALGFVFGVSRCEEFNAILSNIIVSIEKGEKEEDDTDSDGIQTGY